MNGFISRELLLNGDIDGVDFKAIKNEAEPKIIMLEAKIAEFKSGYIRIEEVEQVLDKALENLCMIDEIYCESSACDQREIIGSIYPEKFTFENLQHRTAQVDGLFQLIWLINSRLRGKKNGTELDFSSLSHRVIPLG